MSAHAFLRRAAALGVCIRVVGGQLRLGGPAAAIGELLPHLPAVKAELLGLFARTRYDRPVTEPEERWERDWRGVLCNLAGKRGSVHVPN